MNDPTPKVTIHMAASLDGFIAKTDGSVDWMETVDEFDGGEPLDAATMEQVLQSIDCYVMGSRTYETALAFEKKGMGWAYGDTPTIVLTHRDLPRNRPTVELYAGNLRERVESRLKSRFGSIWFVGGGNVCGECLRQGLADEVRVSVLPVVIGAGVSFFEGLDETVALHLVEAKSYRNGMVALRHEVRR